jgi:hypothetical protein
MVIQFLLLLADAVAGFALGYIVAMSIHKVKR